jgi:hypothetical protein
MVEVYDRALLWNMVGDKRQDACDLRQTRYPADTKAEKNEGTR